MKSLFRVRLIGIDPRRKETPLAVNFDTASSVNAWFNDDSRKTCSSSVTTKKGSGGLLGRCSQQLFGLLPFSIRWEPPVTDVSVVWRILFYREQFHPNAKTFFANRKKRFQVAILFRQSSSGFRLHKVPCIRVNLNDTATGLVFNLNQFF